MALLMNSFRTKALSGLNTSMNLICSTSHAYVSTKSTRVTEIPEKPKRPLSPFFRYMKETRSSVSLPNVSGDKDSKVVQSNVVKHLGQLWQNESQDKKQKYKEDYDKENVEYLKRLADYEKNLTPEQKSILQQVKEDKETAHKKKSLKSKRQSLGQPKRPATGYVLYYTETLKKISVEGKTREEIMALNKEVARSWNKMTDAEKDVYINQYLKAKDQYKKQLTLWEDKMIKEGNMDVISSRSLAELTTKPQKLAKAPKSHPEATLKPKATKSK